MSSKKIHDAQLEEELTGFFRTRSTVEFVKPPSHRSLVPVMCGSAYKNKGVQLLLNAVNYWLPCPTDVPNFAMDPKDESITHEVESVSDAPLLALAFKLEDGRYGQLTYLRFTLERCERCNHLQLTLWKQDQGWTSGENAL